MLSGDDLVRAIRDKAHHPATASELIRLLRIPKESRSTFKRQLRLLTEAGTLVEVRGRRFGLPDRMDLVVGRMQGHAAGYGFVTPERPLDAADGPERGERTRGDIYIAAANIRDALHGDRVVVRIERVKDDGRLEGKVVQILERRSTTIVARIDSDPSGLIYGVPFDTRLTADIGIARGDAGGAEAGQMALVEITRWPTPTRGPLGRVARVLGDINAPGVDTEIILRKYDIPDAHSPEAVAEAERLGDEVRPRDLEGRTDFRDRVVVTIDGEHARDFDDAISLTRLPNGHYWLGVHIADVAHYVKDGSALDRDGYERGTSVYFPERAVHMFPAPLATGLCSLRPHLDRLVQSCLMEVNGRGEVVRYELHDGVIRSDHRMTYTAVNAILNEPTSEARHSYRELVPFFESMRDLFEILNGRRRRRGSIDFDMPEPEVVLDASGQIEDIIIAERNVAHRLIEEFMLLANETVAAHLESRGMPALYRIHEPPDPMKVAEFDEFVSALGFSLAAPEGSVKPAHFQRLVEKIRGVPEERPIAFLMLRTMQKARYDAANLGHFGLAASTYTHFTSPIRRYPDLVVHRLLRELRSGAPDEDRREELTEDLPEVGRHTSERERRASDAERELVQWKKVRFMADKVGETFTGYITGVAPFGLFVELSEHFVEGLVHVSTMADDYYRFSESAHALFGESTRKRYRLGDRVEVQVVRVDLDQRQIQLGLENILEQVRGDERRRGPRRSQTRVKREQRKGTPEERRRRKATRLGRKERAAVKDARGKGARAKKR